MECAPFEKSSYCLRSFKWVASRNLPYLIDVRLTERSNIENKVQYLCTAACVCSRYIEHLFGYKLDVWLPAKQSDHLQPMVFIASCRDQHFLSERYVVPVPL